MLSRRAETAEIENNNITRFIYILRKFKLFAAVMVVEYKIILSMKVLCNLSLASYIIRIQKLNDLFLYERTHNDIRSYETAVSTEIHVTRRTPTKAVNNVVYLNLPNAAYRVRNRS